MEFAAKVALVFILLFVGMAYAIYIYTPTSFVVLPCSGTDISCGVGVCNNCNGFDGFVGERFCSGKNIYQAYRDYYCENNECVYTESNKSIENCDIKDGWVDVESYSCCDGNDKCLCKKQAYIDYSCSAGYCAEKTTQERTVKVDCKQCIRCQYGDCIGCNSDSDCGENEWMGESKCSGDDVYQEYRTYKCKNPGTGLSYCTYSDSQKLKKDCGSGGYDSWEYYCKDGDVYRTRNYFDRGCSDGKCYANWNIEKEEKYEDCYYGCSGGSCRYSYYDCDSCDCGRDPCRCDSCDRCSPGWTNNYRCSSGALQREYQYSDCRKEYREWEDCDALDGYVGPRYCSGGNVYQRYRDYYCSGSSCIYTEREELIERCNPGCSNGYCTGEQSCACTDTSCGVYPNCKDCNANDGYIDSKYCFNGNVYQTYRDYFCSGTTCVERDEKRLIETCSYGCSNGYCIQQTYSCSGTDYSCGIYPNCVNCNSYDGYTGSRYCSGGNVYQTYRDYYCTGTSCSYTDRNVLVESCAYPCYSGACGYYPYDYCTSGWLNDYNCYGSWLQRAYQYADCGRDWVDWEYCTYGCSGSRCLTYDYYDYCYCDGCWGYDYCCDYCYYDYYYDDYYYDDYYYDYCDGYYDYYGNCIQNNYDYYDDYYYDDYYYNNNCPDCEYYYGVYDYS